MANPTTLRPLGFIPVPPINASCLRIGVGMLPPYVRFEPPFTSFYGMSVDLLRLLAKELKFCYSFVREPKNNYGYELPNGTWTGLTGMLVSKKIHFTLNPLAVTYDRSRVIDFSEYINIDEHAIVYRYPALAPDVAGFVRPFSQEVWILTFVMTAVTALFFTVTSVGYRYLHRRGYQEKQLTYKQRHLSIQGPPQLNCLQLLRDFSSQAYIAVKVLLGLGEPKSEDADVQQVKSHVSFGTWLLVCAVLGFVYKSNLMSMLISPRIHIPFNNFEDLVQQHEYIYKMPSGSVFADVAQRSAPDSLLGRVYSHSSGMEEDPLKVADSVHDGVYAFIIYRESALSGLDRGVTRYGRCDTAVTPGGLLRVIQAIGFPKKSLWKPKIDNVIRSLNRFGIINKMLKDYRPNATLCLDPVRTERSKNVLRPLSVKDFLGLMTLCSAGMLLGFAVLLIEICVGFSEKRKEKRMKSFRNVFSLMFTDDSDGPALTPNNDPDGHKANA